VIPPEQKLKNQNPPEQKLKAQLVKTSEEFKRTISHKENLVHLLLFYNELKALIYRRKGLTSGSHVLFQAS
jgi:hypothetical protein